VQVFETKEDRSREASVANRIAPILGVSLIRTRPLCCADYFVQDASGEVSGLMEIRTRTYTAERLGDMGGIFLPERKLKLLYKLTFCIHMDFYFVVKTTNCLLHLCFTSDKPWPRLDKTYGGRADKRYEQDEGTLYLFPTTLFTRIDDDPARLPATSP
jgi:hypothetical protein